MKGRQGERVRLYVRGTVLGYKRSKSNQYPNTSLIQIEGVNTQEEVNWYKGKRMAYIYKAKTKKTDLTTVAFGEKSLGLMVTAVLSVPSSLQTYHQSQWELESEFSCTRATYEEA